MQCGNNFVLFSRTYSFALCVVSVGATYKSYLIKLKRLQNKALRTISKTKIRGRITLKYYKYEILKLEDLYNFEIAKSMYRFTHSKLPLNFKHYFAYSFDVSSYSTRHTYSNDIFYRDL